MLVAVGIKNDGAASVIISGVIREIFREVAVYLKPDKLSAEAKPIFDHNAFWLELEGIAKLHPVQIICAAIRRKLSKMRKGK